MNIEINRDKERNSIVEKVRIGDINNRTVLELSKLLAGIIELPKSVKVNNDNIQNLQRRNESFTYEVAKAVTSNENKDIFCSSLQLVECIVSLIAYYVQHFHQKLSLISALSYERILHILYDMLKLPTALNGFLTTATDELLNSLFQSLCKQLFRDDSYTTQVSDQFSHFSILV